MPESFDDRYLDAVLASVGRSLVVPDAPAPVTWLPTRAASRRSVQTGWLVAAVLAVLVLLSGLIVTPVREAVADWLGIGSTSIEHVHGPEGDPSGLPTLAADAVPSTPAGARVQLGGRPVPVIGRLGAPAILAIPREGGVLMGWPRGKTTLWVHDNAGDGPGFVKKLFNVPDDVRPVPGLGDAAALIDGAHVLETPPRRLAAGRVLIWVVDDVEYRLESDLPTREMVEVARSVSSLPR